jgi:hypothetical protein
MFGASPKVRGFLFENGVSEDTQFLTDFKFLNKVMAVLINVLHYKPKLTIDQFFRYGFAEQKMLLCVDVIDLVRKKHKQLKIVKQLNQKRERFNRSLDAGQYTNVSHYKGKETTFKYERNPPQKTTKLSQVKVDLTTPRKSVTSRSQAPTSERRRTRSYEVT